MSTSKRKIDIKKLTYVAVLTAIVVVLQFVPIKIATFELALSVPVIVIGAALCGTGVGAWLGFVFGAVVLMLPGTAAYMSFNAFGTVLTVLAKGTLAGLAAGAVYKLSEKINRYVAALIAAVTATLVNTGVFLIGSLIFFEGDIGMVISVLISVNFLIELAVNVVLAPTVYRVVNIKKK
ncbi:MAG: ECF transporter S component [Clostridia bacterium]|nr:ECF transporter S component [Clostridia bacterium]